MSLFTAVFGVAGALLVSNASAAVITPIGAAATNDGGFQSPAGSFDAQPATEPTAGTTTASFGNSPSYFPDAGRAVYFDFGPSYADVTIERVYLGLKQDGTNSSANVSYFFSNDIDKAFEPIEGDVVAPNFGIFNFTSSNAAKSWLQVYSGPNQAVQQRYLIAQFNGGTLSNRVQEIVFIGNTTPVPEPTSLALVAVGGLMALRRRR
ncbi:MAG TPA: PEP-CTERM sorting domain-containing protein [Tepidisphaeraceae bacterium]|jgi:hypothetical protein|nr:PEP-CTERM sorting domain-containing protein [Tepidisphaeraceae bacterium]